MLPGLVREFELLYGNHLFFAANNEWTQRSIEFYLLIQVGAQVVDENL